MVIDTWWTTRVYVNENYLLSINISDANGLPKVTNDDLLAHSPSGAWDLGSQHLDRRLLNIPASVSPGVYNLVITLRGTIYDTNNLPVFTDNGSPSGTYAFLFNVTVTD